MVMKVPLAAGFLLIALAHGVFRENTEFDDKMREIIRTNGGDASFLNDFIDDEGFPKSLRGDNYQNAVECSNIQNSYVYSESLSKCTVLESISPTILDISGWSGYGIFQFSVGLRSLKRVTLQLLYQQELTYLYFSSFRKCEECHFNLSFNPALVGLRFPYLAQEQNLAGILIEHRPKITLRGNSRLKLGDQDKRETLKRICNPAHCEIQEDQECHFRYPIRTEEEYKNCKFVYGDMFFTERFDTIQPNEMNFWLDGCFHFNRTGIRIIRNIMRARVNCSAQHTFIHNKYMCTDHIDELRTLWGDDSIKEVSLPTPVNCYQGECRGGYLAEKNKDLFTGCETVKGNLYISRKSGNLSSRIRDLSYIHEIHGQFQLVNNPTITTLGLPFLKHINATKCPALTILKMDNLENIIFHPHIVFDCAGPGPKVMVRRSPKIHLHHQMLKKMKVGAHVLEDFEYDINHYQMENITIYLICVAVGIVMVVEIIAAAHRRLLLPNFLYRVFPVNIKQRPKQKPLKPLKPMKTE